MNLVKVGVCWAKTTEYDNYKMANQALTRQNSNSDIWEGNPLSIAQMLTPITGWTWQSRRLLRLKIGLAWFLNTDFGLFSDSSSNRPQRFSP